VTSGLRGVRIAGTGSYLPSRVVTNEELSRRLDTSDEWIRSRTGIGERRFAADEQATSDLAVPACQAALEQAGRTAADVDLIVAATLTPDYRMPSLAAMIQRGLGAEGAGGFDVGSACSGFVYAMAAGASFVRSGASRCAVVVAAEKMSSITDHDDRATAVIFGDGAGAVVLEPADPAEADLLAQRRGLRGDDDTLVLPGGGSRHPLTAESLEDRAQYMKMKGRETYKFAVKTFASLIEGTCADAGVAVADLAAIVPHQVNLRILEAACQRAGLPFDRCVINIERVGNTSAASVPIALDEHARAGKLRRGDLVLLLAFGAGLSWGSTLLRW